MIANGGLKYHHKLWIKFIKMRIHPDIGTTINDGNPLLDATKRPHLLGSIYIEPMTHTKSIVPTMLDTTKLENKIWQFASAQNGAPPD